MKKILTTAFVLGALYGTAQAATITSPIYMPTKGDNVSTLNIGYTKSSFDTATADGANTKDDFEKSWDLGLNGGYGISDKLSLNYGFDLLFNREMRSIINNYQKTTDKSSKLKNVYLGLTGRAVDADANKFDILFNVGQQAEKYWSSYNYDQNYASLAVRYGLDLGMYNMALSVGSKFVGQYQDDNEKIDSSFNYFAKLENELIFADNFTMGLDLFYNYTPKTSYNDGVQISKYKAFSEYGFNVDLNYALNDSNFLGLYFGMSDNNITQNYSNGGTDLHYEDLTEYNGGIKLTTKF